jgi:hypothetical protein
LAAGKMRKWSQAAFGIILQNRRRLPVSQCPNSRSGLLEGFSNFVSNFKGASENFEFDFFIQLRNKKL